MSSARYREPSFHSLEQIDAQVSFERTHLPADGGGRYGQLVSSLGNAQQTPGRLERPGGI